MAWRPEVSSYNAKKATEMALPSVRYLRVNASMDVMNYMCNKRGNGSLLTALLMIARSFLAETM